MLGQFWLFPGFPKAVKLLFLKSRNARKKKKKIGGFLIAQRVAERSKHHHPRRAAGQQIPAPQWESLSKGKIPRDGWFFKNHWSNHDVGNHCRYRSKMSFLQQPKKPPDEGKEKLSFQAEGEARRPEKKWRQNSPLANELSCLVGELVPDTTKENQYFKSQQIKTDYSMKFIFRMGNIPVICKNTYGGVWGGLGFFFLT